MPTSSDADGAGRPPRTPPRHGFLAWFVFLLAIAVVLSITGGCMALIYGPVLTG